MKIALTFFTATLLTYGVYAQYKQTAPSPAGAILNGVAQKLRLLKSLKYQHTRELNYASENYRNITAWTVYYDFTPDDSMAGFRYQAENAAARHVYNGTEMFDLNETARTFVINDHPVKAGFSNLSFLYNSLVTLRNVLPLLIDDNTVSKTAADTVIKGVSYHIVTINTGKRRIQNPGLGFDTMQTPYNFIYKLFIMPGSYLPAELLQTNDLNTDFIRTTFNGIQVNPGAPGELSWYYSTYTSGYKKAVKTVPQLTAPGLPAPPWNLALLNSGKMVSLNSLKGQVVVLEFWINNCGACIQSVPHLNSLQQRLKGNPFKIMAINAYDAEKDVSLFYNRNRITYSVLLNGRQAADKYGVSAFPAFFVIDKNGTVVYSRTGYDAVVLQEIEAAVRKAL
jgi:thiol-disulfide isomerase/thioredoxin